MTADHIVAQHAAVRATMLRLRIAQRDQLDAACTWADTHPWLGDLTDRFDVAPQLAGDGTPLVDLGSLAEFAALLETTTASGERLITEALELRHRLPRLWERVRTLDLSADHARRIASRTTRLSADAANWVDRHLVAFAGRVSIGQLERTVEAARITAGDQVDNDVTDDRHVTIRTDSTSVNGYAELTGILDAADGADLAQAIQRGAAQQLAWGSPAELNARRSLALGDLARRQGLLPSSEDSAGDEVTETHDAPAPRPITLQLLLPADALVSSDDVTQLGTITTTAGVVTAEQVQAWCGAPGSRVNVRPVIDLNQPASTECYTPTERISEQVRLTHPTCVFPWCAQSSQRCDLDHIVPFAAGGPTSTDNLVPLCRRHHRLKTFHGWRYRRTGAIEFEWISPAGEVFRRRGPLSFPAEVDPSAPPRSRAPLPTLPTSLPPPGLRRPQRGRTRRPGRDLPASREPDPPPF